MNNIPRRNQYDRLTTEEKQIFACIEAVEALGAHPLLTETVILLGQANNALADWFDGPAQIV